MRNNFEVGGARVNKRFSLGGRQVIPGDMLSEAEYHSIRPANRASLEDRDYIRAFPKMAPGEIERIVVYRGGGKFDVYQGAGIVKLNADPLTKDEANILAGNGAGAPDPEAEPS